MVNYRLNLQMIGYINKNCKLTDISISIQIIAWNWLYSERTIIVIFAYQIEFKAETQSESDRFSSLKNTDSYLPVGSSYIPLNLSEESTIKRISFN